MLDYMDYILRSFERTTNWNCDNSYANITATSRALLEFPIPTGLKFQISNASTPFTFNTMEVSTKKIFNGSLTYLYTDADNLDRIVQNSAAINLQDATETYRYFQPFYNHKLLSQSEDKNSKGTKSLYYGRMFYPNSNLEAMLVKRLTFDTQLILKCLSSFNDFNILTCYWQRDTGKNSQEVIFSTNDFLCGYRFLHNFLGAPSKMKTSLYNNSSLSLGGEIWLGLITLSPGCSTTLRYCTHAPNTGRPLTLTFTWNPIFGHLSSTYTAKTSKSSTFCAKYDFNLYSIESNLSFGCEFWKKGIQTTNTKPVLEFENHEDQSFPKDDNLMYYHLLAPNPHKSAGSSSQMKEEHQHQHEQEQQLLDDLTTAFSTSLKKIDKEKSVIERFENAFNHSNFTSVWKVSTSLRDKKLKILWEGKFKGFLISTGTELCKTDTIAESDNLSLQKNKIPIYPAKFGIQLQYST